MLWEIETKIEIKEFSPRRSWTIINSLISILICFSQPAIFARIVEVAIIQDSHRTQQSDLNQCEFAIISI